MFSIIWSSSAQGAFTVIAFTHFDRALEIEEAGDEIEGKLQSDPTGSGQHISEGLWRIESGPLAALYSIEGDQVLVDAVRWIG